MFPILHAPTSGPRHMLIGIASMPVVQLVYASESFKYSRSQKF
jgi:hypothetical protein